MAIRNNESKKNKDAATAALIAEQYAGSLPTAAEFARYKEVLTDAPERIFKVFEEDSKHTREMQRVGLEGAITFDKRSQWMAFTIIAIGLGLTAFALYLDKDAAAIIAGLGTLVLIFKGAFSARKSE